jgi:hypothetical protein
MDEKFVLSRIKCRGKCNSSSKGIILNHLGSEELAQKIASAEFVIAVQDIPASWMVKLGKPMILVPTPDKPNRNTC